MSVDAEGHDPPRSGARASRAIPLRPQRSARSGLGPLLLCLPLLAAALWVLHQLENPPGRAHPLLGERVDLEPPVAVPEAVRGFLGSSADGEVAVWVRLSPFHTSATSLEFKAAALRSRFGLEVGELWRLEVACRSQSELRWEELTVADGGGTALRPLVDGEPAPAPAPDPMRALFRPPSVVSPGETLQVALWGHRPESGARVVFDGTPKGALEVALAVEELAVADLPKWFVQPAATAPVVAHEREPAVDPRDEEIAELRAALAREHERRQQRELEWYEYNRALAGLDVEALIAPFRLDPDPGPDAVADGADPEPEPEADELRRREERADEIAGAIRARMRLDRILGFELLEVGSLERGALRPAIFRLLDARGRLGGSLYAERLRFECSRSARTLTFVLEEGYESRGGERVPFEDGLRRIVFPFVDPLPWLDSMPELFPPSEVNPPLDDGLWDHEGVRRELNRLLGLDITAGWYRVQGLGGVKGDWLVDVHLEAFDATGRLERRFFADRLRVVVDDEGVMLLLEGGAAVRGQEKFGFPGGTHRLYLPRTPLESWRGAALPGLGDPPLPAGPRPSAPGAGE